MPLSRVNSYMFQIQARYNANNNVGSNIHIVITGTTYPYYVRRPLRWRSHDSVCRLSRVEERLGALALPDVHSNY